MKHLYALVMMQLKDKLDFSFTSSTRRLISKIVFTVLKFLIVAAVAYVVFTALPLLIFKSGIPIQLMVFVLGLIFLMSLFSCTAGLMKTLYFADDNKVLVTMPVNANVLFVSKLIVYYVYELKRSFFFTVPIFISFGMTSNMPGAYYPWIIFAFIFISALPVVVGALLSIPVMYVYSFVKKHAWLQFSLYLVLIAVVLFVSIKVIGLIPENINLIEQGGTIERYILSGLYWLEKYLYPVNWLVTMLCGKYIWPAYTLAVKELPLYFGYLIGMLAVFGGITFAASRPLFFTMISKTIEFEKIPPKTIRPDVKRSPFATFLRTELLSLLRSQQLGTFVTTYIVVPVLIYLLNKVFGAMDLNASGVNMVYAFNLLVMLLPILAANSVVATLYSRDGRAAYVKKTIPQKPYLPLFIKIMPLMVASAISLIASVIVFSRFVGLSGGQITMLCISLVGIQWGHMMWSGMLDLMNPQNEQYATTGNVEDNPNESLATIIAFIVAALYTVIAFILFPEGTASACLKLCIIGLAFLAALAYIYFTKIKVYFYEK